MQCSHAERCAVTFALVLNLLFVLFWSQVDFTKEGCGSDNVCKSKLQVAYRYGHWTPRDETFTPLRL